MPKKVLFICKAGVRRSATAANIFSLPPYKFNTKARGIGSHAIVVVASVDLKWADEVICMNTWQLELLMPHTTKDIYCFKISDKYEYMDKTLIEILKEKYEFKDELI